MNSRELYKDIVMVDFTPLTIEYISAAGVPCHMVLNMCGINGERYVKLNDLDYRCKRYIQLLERKGEIKDELLRVRNERMVIIIKENTLLLLWEKLRAVYKDYGYIERMDNIHKIIMRHDKVVNNFIREDVLDRSQKVYEERKSLLKEKRRIEHEEIEHEEIDNMALLKSLVQQIEDLGWAVTLRLKL